MFFFTRKKEIILDAFVNDEGISNYYPIERASKFMPKWWKEIPPNYIVQHENGAHYPIPTIKNCTGVVDYYKHGFIIPLWTDFAIETKQDGTWAYVCAMNSKLDEHPRIQYGPTFDNFIHLKFVSPWFIKEKSGIEFLSFSPTWNNIKYWNTINIIPGVLEFRSQHSTNTNMFVNKTNQVIHFQAGEPMLHFIALSDTKKIKIKTHVVSNEEIDKLNMARNKFLNTYKEKRKIDSEKSKCPFGFK